VLDWNKLQHQVAQVDKVLHFHSHMELRQIHNHTRLALLHLHPGLCLGLKGMIRYLHCR
jgi:hypothetical protein